jgi:hypothetical protein
MEFIFGKSCVAEAFCKAQGWKPDGRAAWAQA